MVSSILLEMNNVLMQCPFLSREFLKRLLLSLHQEQYPVYVSIYSAEIHPDLDIDRKMPQQHSFGHHDLGQVRTKSKWKMKSIQNSPFGNIFNKLQLFLQIFPHFWEKCFQNTKCFGAKANVIDFLTTFAQTCQHEWQILPFVWWIFLTRAKHLAKCLHSALESHTNWNQYTGKYCHFVGKNGRVWCLTNFLPCWQFLQQN